MTKITPHNVFTPAKEVQDIDRFAGRVDVLDSVSSALQSDGTQLIVYGRRGVGKSSLASVLEKISTNEVSAISRLKTKPHRQFDYLPIKITCDDSIDSIDRLCIRLLSDPDGLARWIPFQVAELRNTTDKGGRLGIKVIELSGNVSDSTTERRAEVDADPITVFVQACKRLVASKVAVDGLLIIVDEFDRIGDKRGIASLIKSLGSTGVTFALIGVAKDINELIADHESVARQLADGTIYVRPMDQGELSEIIHLAMGLLDDKYKFSVEAVNWIVDVAKGHPFYVHLLGKHALLKAINSTDGVVTEAMAKEALAEIALKGSAPVQEAAYKKAVGHSYIREFILKGFAQEDSDEIHTTNLYSDLSKRIGIDSSAISVYVGQLTNEKYGAVLEKVRERYYQFKDSLFKAYAAARPFERKVSDREDET